jgi:hypothetical protein
MQDSVETKVVCRFIDEDKDVCCISYVYRTACGDLEFSTSYGIEEAMDLSEFSEEEQYDLFMRFQEQNSDYDCEFIKLTVTTKVENMMEGNDTLKELRQKHALSKLTEREVKVLGLSSIATYIKTKYHNA